MPNFTVLTAPLQLPELVNNTSIQPLSSISTSISIPALPKLTNIVSPLLTSTALDQSILADNSTKIDNINSSEKVIQRPKKIIIKAKILND